MAGLWLSPQIIAKVENAEGLENFDSILMEANGILIGRGDMGYAVDWGRSPGL
jgi:pyruvate kinase